MMRKVTKQPTERERIKELERRLDSVWAEIGTLHGSIKYLQREAAHWNEASQQESSSRVIGNVELARQVAQVKRQTGMQLRRLKREVASA